MKGERERRAWSSRRDDIGSAVCRDERGHRQQRNMKAPLSGRGCESFMGACSPDAHGSLHPRKCEPGLPTRSFAPLPSTVVAASILRLPCAPAPAHACTRVDRETHVEHVRPTCTPSRCMWVREGW